MIDGAGNETFSFLSGTNQQTSFSFFLSRAIQTDLQPTKQGKEDQLVSREQQQHTRRRRRPNLPLKEILFPTDRPTTYLKELALFLLLRSLTITEKKMVPLL
jgi:hypothetical protein